MNEEKIFGNLDLPNEKIPHNSNELRIAGWSFSTLGNEVVIEIFIDEKKTRVIKTGKKRPDLTEAYSEYDLAITSGFDTVMKISEIGDGAHFLKVVSKSNKIEKLLGKEIKFELSPDKITEYGFLPTDKHLIKSDKNIIGDIILPFDRDVIQNDELIVKGWNFSTLNHKILVSFLINGKKVAETTPSIEMPDVQKIYRKFEGSLKSGFFTKINLADLKEGNHILKIFSNSNNDEKLLGTINFVLKRS